jgi:hypothetical protein
MDAHETREFLNKLENNSLQRELLARVDERTDNTAKAVQALGAQTSRAMDIIDKQSETLRSHMAQNYVTIERFSPVERTVYGVVTLILLAVFGGIIALVIK